MPTLEERITQVEKATGFVEDERDRAVEEYEGFTYGERVRVIDDDENEGAFAGDEGVIVIGQVGAEEHRNVRTMLGFIGEGMDSPIEVQPDNIEPVE